MLVAAFVCVAPSLLFLGLWNGLQRMQNGELVERVADHHGATVEDLVQGAQSSRMHDPDPGERRALQRSIGHSAPPTADSSADDREPRDESSRF